jgi:hypothetical protein
MSKALERIAIAAVAAAAAFAIATATGQGGNERGGFIDIPRGQEARFLGTTTTCVNPKGQIPGGQVACTVNYRAPRSPSDLVPVKFDVGLTLRCVELGKWSRVGPRMLKSGHFC